VLNKNLTARSCSSGDKRSDWNA